MEVDEIPMIGELANSAVKLSAQALKYSSKIAYSAVGHYLHSFLDAETVRQAEALCKKIESPENNDVDQELKRILCLQRLEAEQSTKSNKQADADAPIRAKRELQYLKAIQRVAVKKRSWLSSLFGKAGKDEKKGLEEAQETLVSEGNLAVEDADQALEEELDQEIAQIQRPEAKRDANFRFERARAGSVDLSRVEIAEDEREGPAGKEAQAVAKQHEPKTPKTGSRARIIEPPSTTNSKGESKGMTSVDAIQRNGPAYQPRGLVAQQSDQEPLSAPTQGSVFSYKNDGQPPDRSSRVVKEGYVFPRTFQAPQGTRQNTTDSKRTLMRAGQNVVSSVNPSNARLGD